MSFSSKDLFGDISDLEDGFSDDGGNEFTPQGKEISKRISEQKPSVPKSSSNAYRDKQFNKSDTWKSKNTNLATKDDPKNMKVVRDVFSGIRLVNPLVSSMELQSMMQGRKFLKLSDIKRKINPRTNDIDDDWVTMGVVINKASRKSKNGNDYSLWKLNDLQSETMVNLFLFGKSNERHWKIQTGSVIGLLNSKIMEDSNSGKSSKINQELSLTIDDPDKLLMIGHSKDMGFCKATKKNGELCNNLISKADDEYCLYHIKSAYNKFSAKRAELQSSFTNATSNDIEMQFSNSISVKNIDLKMTKIKQNQMKIKKEEESKKIDKTIVGSASLAAKNLVAHKESQKNLSEDNSSCTGDNSGRPSMKTFEAFFSSIQTENKPSTKTNDTPKIGKGLKRGQSLDFTVSASQLSEAKKRAVEIMKNKPSAVPSGKSLSSSFSSGSTKVSNKKLSDILNRVNKSLNCSNNETIKEQEEAKKKKDDLLKKALERKSINGDIVEDIERDRQDAYLNRLEKKEKMELKMIETKQMKVKTVTCKICKYTAQSQSDVCKSFGHRVEFSEKMKKFFSCKKCKNRTATYTDVLPTKSCGQCGANAWEKAGMIRDKVAKHVADGLLVRGEEIKFLNSVN